MGTSGQYEAGAVGAGVTPCTSHTNYEKEYTKQQDDNGWARLKLEHATSMRTSCLPDVNGNAFFTGQIRRGRKRTAGAMGSNTVVELRNLTVNDLRQKCDVLKLRKFGKKEELVQRVHEESMREEDGHIADPLSYDAKYDRAVGYVEGAIGMASCTLV